MPEFVQEKQTPYSKIIIRCASEEDLQDLARRLEQPLTSKTKSIWHPKLMTRGLHSSRRYVDESTVSDLHSVEGQMEVEAHQQGAGTNADFLSDSD